VNKKERDWLRVIFKTPNSKNTAAPVSCRVVLSLLDETDRLEAEAKETVPQWQMDEVAEKLNEYIDKARDMGEEIRIILRALENTVPRVLAPYYMTASERIAEASAEIAAEDRAASDADGEGGR